MRWITCLAVLTLGVAIPASALAQDITGAWDVSVESPQGSITVETTFAQDGEVVTGTVMSPMGRVDFTGTIVDDQVSISYSVPLPGQTLEMMMTGTVAGDTMEGIVTLGEAGEVSWSARRRLAVPGADTVEDAVIDQLPTADDVPMPASGASGMWNVLLEMPQSQFAMLASFEQDGDQIVGTLGGPVGPIPVGGTMIGNKLKLEFVIQTPNGDVPVVMTGLLGPTGFAGSANLGGLGEGQWTATWVE